MAERNELQGIIEALLFVAQENLTIKQLSEIIEKDRAEIKEELRRLQQEYKINNYGFELREVAGGYRLFTNPVHVSYIEKLVMSSDYRRLTQAALETLAIVAYKQPITKAEISDIRGVNVDSVLYSLLRKGLVKEVGRKDTPGQPFLYGTTKHFIESLGLNSLKDLPSLGQFEPTDEEKKKIAERLSTQIEMGVNQEEVEYQNSGEEDIINPSNLGEIKAKENETGE